MLDSEGPGVRNESFVVNSVDSTVQSLSVAILTLYPSSSRSASKVHSYVDC